MQTPDDHDIVPPDGFVFIVDAPGKLGHLAASDDERLLPVCGAAGSGVEAPVLSAAFAICPSCLTIADEASSRPY